MSEERVILKNRAYRPDFLSCVLEGVQANEGCEVIFKHRAPKRVVNGAYLRLEPVAGELNGEAPIPGVGEEITEGSVDGFVQPGASKTKLEYSATCEVEGFPERFASRVYERRAKFFYRVSHLFINPCIEVFLDILFKV